MNVIGTLAVFICIAAVAAPYVLRDRGTGWISRLCFALGIVGLVTAPAWAAHGMQFGLWVGIILASCFALGEIVLLIEDGLRPTLAQHYARHAQNPMGTPAPIPAGWVSTRPPQPAPEAKERLVALIRQGATSVPPGGLTQRRV